MRQFELSGHFTGNPNFTSPGQETQEKIQDCKATVLEFKASSLCACLHLPTNCSSVSLPPPCLQCLVSDYFLGILLCDI